MAKTKFGNFITKWTPLGWLGQLYGKVFNSETLSDLGAAIENAVKYYSHSGVTDERKEDLKLQDEYLDENRKAEQDWQEYFYNKYQSAPAQVAQYQEAGLNPMLLAGGAAGASAATSPSGQAPSSSQSSADPIAALMSIVSVASQAQDLGASAALKKSQKEHQDIVNKWEDRQQESIYNERVANTENLKANLPKLLADAQHAEFLAQWAPQLFQSQVVQNNANAEKAIAAAAEARSNVALNKSRKAEVDELIKNHQKEREQMDALIMKIQQECITLSTQAYLNDQLVQESMARCAKYEKQVELIGAQIGLTDLDVKYYSWNHAHEVSTRNPIATIYKEIYPTDELRGIPNVH